MEGNGHCSAQFFILSSCRTCKYQNKDGQLELLLHTPRLPQDVRASAGCGAPRTGWLARLRACAPHPRLPSPQAGSRERPEWLGAQARHPSPAAPAHPPAKLPWREGRVSGVSRFLPPFPSPGSPGLPHQQDGLYWATIMGTAPYFSNLWRWSVPRRPVPSPCPSGLQVAGLVVPPLIPQRRRSVWEEGVSPSPHTDVPSSPQAQLAGDSNRLGSWFDFPPWSFKAPQLIFIPVFPPVFFDICYWKSPGHCENCPQALHPPPAGCLTTGEQALRAERAEKPPEMAGERARNWCFKS